MNERSLLSALIYDRAAWDRVEGYLSEEDFSAPGQRIVEEVRAYYERDPAAERCDLETLRARIKRSLPKPELIEKFDEIFAGLTGAAGTKNAAEELLELRRQNAGHELAQALLGPARPDPEELTPLLERFTALNEAQKLGPDGGALERYQPTIEELFLEIRDDSQRVKLAPSGINKFIAGGPFPGHCVVLFGRVNVGKSLHARNFAAGFVFQGKTVLWIENEDSNQDVLSAMTCRLLRKPESWVKEHPEEAARMAVKKGISRFILTKDPPVTVNGVRAAMDHYKPDVVVVNQMRHFAASGDERKQISQLDKLAHDLRFLGKRTDTLMVLVTAAKEGETDRTGYAKEKAVLEQSDCYSSRTGIPGAADLMIGVGLTHKLARNQMACLSLCKNKLGGKKNEVPVYVHVEPETGYVRMAHSDD